VFSGFVGWCGALNVGVSRQLLASYEVLKSEGLQTNCVSFFINNVEDDYEK